MNLTPLFEASPAIKFHVVTVVPAFILGTWLLLGSRKGSPLHRAVGRIYLVLMTLTSIASIFIPAAVGASFTIGPLQFGWIHLFVPITLWGVFAALVTAKSGDIRGHQQAMISTYLGALIVAGGLTFAPGRLMWRMFLE